MQEISWRIEQERQGELSDCSRGLPSVEGGQVRRPSEYSEVSRKIQAYRECVMQSYP